MRRGAVYKRRPGEPSFWAELGPYGPLLLAGLAVAALAMASPWVFVAGFAGLVAAMFVLDW